MKTVTAARALKREVEGRSQLRQLAIAISAKSLGGGDGRNYVNQASGLRTARRLAVIALALVAAVAQAQPKGDPLGNSPIDPNLGSSGSANGGSANGGSPNGGSPSGGSPSGGSNGGSANGAPNGSASGGSANGGSATGSGAGSGSAIIIQLAPEVPEVSAAASPTELKLGGRFTLFVRATASPTVETNIHEPLDLGGAFEVGKRVSQDHLEPDGRRTREWQIDVRVWEIGDVRIPGVTVTYTLLGKAAQTESNTVPLHVTGVLGDSDDPKLMRESAAPMDLHEKSLLAKIVDWLRDPLHLGIVIGALVGAWVGWRFRKLRRRRVTRLVGGLVPMAMARRKIDMTSERALERLLELEQSGQLAADDKRRGGYAEMTDVIRDYLGARFNVLTTEMTSAELKKALEQKANESEQHLVEDWLDRADVVKYGNFPATRDQAYATLEGARHLIITTTKAQGEAA
ncbi:MAG: hypothetical protein QM831_05345 [Kofleriaceae bacterium]